MSKVRIIITDGVTIAIVFANSKYTVSKRTLKVHISDRKLTRQDSASNTFIHALLQLQFEPY